MKTKNIKVAYKNRCLAKGYCSVPMIQMEGRWLEELGFSIGSTIVVEYGEGSLHIRTLTEEEIAAVKQQELKAELKRRTKELEAVEKSLKNAYADYAMVAEPDHDYGGKPPVRPLKNR